MALTFKLTRLRIIAKAKSLLCRLVGAPTAEGENL